MLSRWIRTSIWDSGMSKSQRASTTSRPLFIRVAESMVIFAPIFQFGCCSARSGVTSCNSSRLRVPEGSAGGGEDQAVDVLFAVSFQRLEDRAVFTVDRKNADAMLSRFVLHQFPRHDHRLFIGQRDLLSASNGRQGRDEAGAADNSGNDEFGFGRSGDLDQAFLPSQNFDRQFRTALPQPGGSGGIR